MRGRKPIPSLLSGLHGLPGKRRRKPAEPKPTGDLAEAPGWLTAEQRAGWDYALAHAPPGLLKKLDRGVLVTFVVAEDLHRQAAEALARTGLVEAAPHTGAAIQSVHLAILNRQAAIMLKAAAELGCSPTARARVSVVPAEAETDADIPLEEYLAARPALPSDLRQEGRDRPPRKPH
jgi:P27 family predicted phage terminase small subunit